MFRRLLPLLAVPLLLIGLSSCRSDPTVAAYVGNDQISIDTVDDYYAKALADPISVQQVQQNPGAVKPNLVSMLVYLQLSRDAAEAENVSVTASEIAQAKAQLDVARQQGQITGELSLLPLNDLAEFYAYQVKLRDWAAGGNPDQNAAAQKATQALTDAEKANPVTVNPRFGKFDLAKAPEMGSSDVAVKSVKS